MKKTLTIGLVMMLAACANAAVINLTGMNGTQTPNFNSYNLTTDTGTASQTTFLTGTAAPVDITYTVSGLTLDGVGTADDSVILTYTVSTSGGTIGVHSVGSWGDGGINMDAAGEYIQVDNTSAVVNLGAGATETWTASSVMTYTEFGNWNGTGESGTINGTLYTNGGAADDGLHVNFLPGDELSSIKMQYNSGSWNFGSFGVQVEAIPEPATLGMVAAFGGTILFIRRKLMI